MATKRLPLLVTVLAAGFATSGLAQVPAPVVPVSSGQGMWTADAVGLQWRASDGTTHLGVRDAGTEGAQVSAWSASRFGAASDEHPDYSPEALFAHWVPGLYGLPASAWTPSHALFQPTLGDWSTGGDVTPAVDAQGVLQIGPGAMPLWYNLSITVDDKAVGLPGSAVDQALERSGRASDHIFSYTADGSSLIREDYVHTVRTEFTGPQLLVPDDEPRLTALDWGMGLISETPLGSATFLQPTRNRLYFSVTQEWLDLYQAAHLPGGLQLRSNEIYGMQWSAGQWSAPTVAFSATDLFGSPQPNAELDAISVFSDNHGIGQEPTVVFSLTPDSELTHGGQAFVPDQILVTQRGSYHPHSGQDATAATLSVVTNSSAEPISKAFGLDVDLVMAEGPDNVTGLCGRDPGAELFLFDKHKGIPSQNAAKSSGVGLSLLRHTELDKKSDAGQNYADTLRFAVSGIDPTSYDVTVVDLHLAFYDDVNGELKLIAQLPTYTVFGAGENGLLGGTLPFNVDVGAADEIRAEAIVHGITLSPFEVELNVAGSGSVSIAHP